MQSAVFGENMIRSLKGAILSTLLACSFPGHSQGKPSPGTLAPSSQPIRLTVDATHAPEKILHAQLQIPAASGALTLVYPKWLPGEHAPTGPATDLTGVEFFSNGQRLTWRRDLVDRSEEHTSEL